MITVRDIIYAMRNATEAELKDIMVFLKNQPARAWSETLH